MFSRKNCFFFLFRSNLLICMLLLLKVSSKILKIVLTENLSFSRAQCGKTRNSLSQKKNREINFLVTSLEKTLLSRNFFRKSVRVNSRNFHTVAQIFPQQKVLHHFCKNGVLLPTSTNIHFASIWSFSILKCLSKVRTKFLVLPNFKLYFVRILGVPIQNFSIEFHEIICKT